MAKSTKRSDAIDALDYLKSPEKYAPKNVCAVFGDEPFLKGEVCVMLRRRTLGEGDAELGLTELNGRDAQMRDVRDALASRSLFGAGPKMVLLKDGDRFVSDHRAQLEDYVSNPGAGILVLEVESWPANTRLAKAVAAHGLAVSCSTPKEVRLKTWLVERAKSTHHVTLESAAADALLELVPPEVGVLVQEMEKLATLAGKGGTISPRLVSENVGGWRVRAAWDMIDAAAEGRAAAALGQLDRLISSGEKAQGLLPQMASTFRKFATATDLIESAEADGRRISARDALAQAGVLPFKLSGAEQQLRQIGRRRAKQMTERLLAAELAIKGHNSADLRARMELERLIVHLSAHAGRAGANA